MFLLIQPTVLWAESGGEVKKDSDTKEITMTTTEAMQLAGALVEKGDFEHAKQILTITPQMSNGKLEIERWFLIGQIAQKQGDYDTAIKIYRKILDDVPDLPRIRFELATCYMHTKQWYRADYHLRLAMAGKDLPNEVKQVMNYYRYIIRQNKNWNIWFNFGAAPDSNVNNANGREDCVYGTFCRKLAEPEKAIGFNLQLGGDYEFKLSDHWRWKSEGGFYGNIYDKHKFDDLYFYASSGPRYIWSKGDIWLAPMIARRFYGGNGYNWSYGAKLDTNYDITRKLSAGVYLRFLENSYDNYSEYMNSETYSGTTRLFYAFNSSIYSSLRFGLTREQATNSVYSYWQPSVGLGLGAELPWGFHIYAEPSIYWTNYEGNQYVGTDTGFVKKTEQNITQRYAVSLSNNKFDIWGFVPTLTFSYTKRDSNIWQREYDKTTLEFTMQQRF